MGINFPNTPLVGDIWPSPAVAGQGQYTWDGEKWTAGATPASRASIYAAPFDAMAYNGMQINGSMDVSQERGSSFGYAMTVGAQTRMQDGWNFFYNSAPLVFLGFSQHPGAAPYGIPNAIVFQSTTGKASLASGDQVFLEQPIEGYRVARLNWGTAIAQPITIGFWVFAEHAGTMTVGILGGGSRTYLTNVVVGSPTPNIWEYKTITVPGDTAGTWAKDNAAGMYVRFCFGGGTAVQGAAGTWLAGPYSATSATTNFNAVPNYAGITGVVVLPGIEAPSAARSPLIMRPYDQELVTCRRYWQGPTTFESRNYSAVPNGVFTATTALTPIMRGVPQVLTVGTPVSVNIVGYTRYPAVDSIVHQIQATAAGDTRWSGNFTCDARL